MIKRTLLAVAGAILVVSATAGRADAQSVTVLLKSGERVQGQLASFDQGTVDIRDASGQRRPYQWSDVVLLDFVGNARDLPDTERDAAVAAEATIILKGGRSYRGKVIDFVNEGGPKAAVVFQPADRSDPRPAPGYSTIPVEDIGRIYVSTFTREALAAAGMSVATTPPGGAQTDSATGVTTVTLPATTRWLGTGVFVRRGERIEIASEGTIYLHGSGQDEAKPAGALSARTASGAPLPALLAGALIGRVGDRGVPFGIGDQTSLMMPASGELYLGINDDEVSDNQGTFTVRITRTASALPRD